MLPKFAPTFKYKKIKKYDTGIALYTKKGKALVIYDKWAEIKKKHKTNYNRYSQYKNILRIEFRYRNNNIKNIANKTKMKRYLNEFVTEKNYIDYFLNIIKDYIYTGDFYSLNTTIEMINSSKYSNAIKNHLIDFVTEINKYDLKSVSSHTSRNTIL